MHCTRKQGNWQWQSLAANSISQWYNCVETVCSTLLPRVNKLMPGAGNYAGTRRVDKTFATPSVWTSQPDDVSDSPSATKAQAKRAKRNNDTYGLTHTVTLGFFSGMTTVNRQPQRVSTTSTLPECSRSLHIFRNCLLCMSIKNTTSSVELVTSFDTAAPCIQTKAMPAT